MRVAEEVLFRVAKRLYPSEVSLSTEMKQAMTSADQHDTYRAGLLPRIVASATELGVGITGTTLLDLGCGDGAVTQGYLAYGAERVIGADVDAHALARGRDHFPGVDFRLIANGRISLEDNSVDTIISHDVFEHVADPSSVLAECRRILKPHGTMLIGTWGWYHPFAPHLFAAMPVPWAHVFVSEKTLLRAARRVYQAPWYRPTMHDLDVDGRKIASKYLDEEISTDYVNKLLIADFRRIFKSSGFESRLVLVPFGSRWARWTRVFLKVPFVNEFFTTYFWAVLRKDSRDASSSRRVNP